MLEQSILVVDDNPTNLKLTAFLLKSEGYVVETARDGHRALELMQTLRPHLILMDLQLPGIDGLEVTRRLKANPDTSDIPVVALTAYAMKSDYERAMKAGCAGYISKPIDTRRFRDQVRGYLTQGDSTG